MTLLYIDLETRSQTDLIANGLHRYAQCPTTELICMSYCFDDGPIKTLWADSDIPTEIVEHINSGGKLVAHNAAFERTVLNHNQTLPPIKLTQWVCSSATAMAVGCPGSLRDCAKFLGLSQQKQSDGTRLIRQYCAPGFAADIPEDDKALMREYCEQDVRVMRAIMQCVPALNDEMLNQYHVNEQINDYGVPVDVPFAVAAVELAEEVRADIGKEIQRVTDDKVESHTKRKARDAWLAEKLSEEDMDLLMSKGKLRFDKNHRAQLLASNTIPPDVREFTELVEAAGGATISKYKGMANQHVGGRVMGALVWSGAGQTGRYTSRGGIQFQNMKRDVVDHPEDVREMVVNGIPIDNPANTLARMVRASIHNPDGLTFSDYSQIEARVLPWLADSPLAQPLMQTFWDDEDLYTKNAERIFRKDTITPDERQASKVATLACGFQGGKNAVLAMARMYGLNYTDDQANEIKTLWREANPWANELWNGVYSAATSAVRHKGEVFTHGRIAYMATDMWLWAKLPSGRCIAYYQPRFEETQAPWEDQPSVKLTCAVGSQKPKAGQPWPRRALYPGLLVQGACQSTAADLMREAIVRAHEAGLKVLFSVHDEMVVEGNHKEQLTQIMEAAPAWADGLPIKADTQTSVRYGK